MLFFRSQDLASSPRSSLSRGIAGVALRSAGGRFHRSPEGLGRRGWWTYSFAKCLVSKASNGSKAFIKCDTTFEFDPWKLQSFQIFQSFQKTKMFSPNGHVEWRAACAACAACLVVSPCACSTAWWTPELGQGPSTWCRIGWNGWPLFETLVAEHGLEMGFPMVFLWFSISTLEKSIEIQSVPEIFL